MYNGMLEAWDVQILVVQLSYDACTVVPELS